MKPLSIVKVHKSKLFHLEGNPRQIVDKNAIGKLRTLIKLHGFRGLLDVYQHKDGNFEILCGNHRFEAGCLEGITEFNCQVYEGNRKQALARAVSDNKSNEWTEWNIPGLKDMFTEIDDGSTNMEMTGFEPEEIKALWDDDIQEGLTDPDSVPDKPKKPKTKMGDLYQLGEHRFLCGDATKKEDVDRLMDGNKAGMVFTDPPYGLGGYGGRNKMELKGDDQDIKPFYASIPLLKEIYVCGRVFNLEDINFVPRDIIVWKKNNFGLGRGYRGQYEVCFYKGDFKGSDSDVWDVSKDVDYVHPTQKPTELCCRAIKNSSPKIVLDLFLGSGSTLIACEQTSRKCFGMEIDPIYCDVVVKRWEDFTGKKGKLIADKKG